MGRNLKALGLALMAAFALSAVASSAASAEVATFTTASDATTLTSKALTEQVFGEGSLEVKCKEVNVHSHDVGTDQTSITVEPTYTNCAIFTPSEFAAEVVSNGCDYTFTAGNKTDGTVHLDCSTAETGKKQIEVKIFILGAFRKCLDITPQENLTVDYTNGTEVTGGKNVWDVTVKSTAENISYTKTGSCGEGTFNKAKYTGEVTVWGEDAKGNPLNVTWDPET